RWAVHQAAKLQQEIIDNYNSYQFHTIYQKVHNFCAIDMGGFYLDVIKDRQYTAATEGHARRSAQTALYHIVEALVRWIAPILSFTADEIWPTIPGHRGDSVFLETWYDKLAEFDGSEEMGDSYWQQILKIKTAVNKQIEIARNERKLKASLDTELDLYCDSEIKAYLDQLNEELRFAFITSDARVHEYAEAGEATELEGLRVQVSASEHEKCVRCWHHRPEVGSIEQHPELCHRCVENVEGDGETRHYV
ncbi:MAG: class I tRNA ligase family protein, partial [Pseudomonadales bacterium]|nr:class I tRNA ligase family protein [Pseudomonadales bacterium]